MLVPLILAFDSCGVLFDGACGLDLYFHAYLLFLASVAAVFARVCVADGRACAAPAATAALLVFLFLKLGAAVVFCCYPAVGIHGGDADLPQFVLLAAGEMFTLAYIPNPSRRPSSDRQWRWSLSADPALDPSRARTFIESIVTAPANELVGRKVVVGGWVKTGREQGKGSFTFLEFNDGSCLANLQVIVDAAVFPLSQLVPTGTSVLVDGEFKKPPEGAKQSVELRVEKVLGIGPVDPAKISDPQDAAYYFSLLNLLQISAISRMRNELAQATHTFFRKNGFRYIHTPIITTSDWEGTDEMLQVTPLFSDAEKLEKELQKNPPPSESNVEAAKLIVKEKGDVVSLLKASKARTSGIGLGFLHGD
ncbi:hypothetical protein ZIOFF_002111 [Zingiber officinale]|uniref:OB domain-containing protein n=1 Tax=Zingiber officinale TaxID=94328 RepID=A0A8J5LVL2_ZINOF|nr:hypothetical protein ZIOFF_002111 [Zingiber officinale]